MNSLSCSDMAADLAPKNTSWAPRNRFQSSSSTPRGAEPAAFQRVIRSRYALVVGPQSVELCSASASATSFSLALRAVSRCSDSLANCALRRRV